MPLPLFLVTHNYPGVGVVTAVDEKDGAGRCVTAWNVESIEAGDLGGATLPGRPAEGGTKGGREEKKELRTVRKKRNQGQTHIAKAAEKGTLLQEKEERRGARDRNTSRGE